MSTFKLELMNFSLCFTNVNEILFTATFDMITRNGKQLNVQSYAPDYSGLNVFDDREEYYVAYHDGTIFTILITNTFYMMHMILDEKIKPLLSKTSQEYLDFTENRKKKTISSRKVRSVELVYV